jgi:ABC-type Fe3+ transport system substrate-binding protein
MPRRTAILALLVALAPPCRGAELVIISPHWEGIRKEYERAFSDWYEKRFGERVHIEWLDQGGTSADVKFIESEFSAQPNGINIDLFWGGGIDPYMELADAGLLEPYRLPDRLLSGVPPTYAGLPVYDPEYRWYGTALAGFGIFYNKRVLPIMDLPTPRTWSDLADPRLHTWVGSADPRNSGSVHMMYEIILQAYGWDEGMSVITRMGANVRAFPKSSSAIPKDVALGQVAAGLAIDIYALAQIAYSHTDDLAYVWPEGQTVINPDGIGILKGAPSMLVARRFVDYVMSPAGQRLLMLPPGAKGGPREFTLGRMSVLPALYGELGSESICPADPFAWRSSLKYDPEKGGTRWGLVDDLIGSTIIDLHDDLSMAWRALRDAGMPKAALAVFVQPPMDEREAMEFAAGGWHDQEQRNIAISRWVRFSRDKYRRVRVLCGDPHVAGETAEAVLRYLVPALAALAFCAFVVDVVRQPFVAARRRRSRRS